MLLFQISSALRCLFTGEREEPSDWLSSALPVLMGPGVNNAILERKMLISIAFENGLIVDSMFKIVRQRCNLNSPTVCLR